MSNVLHEQDFQTSSKFYSSPKIFYTSQAHDSRDKTDWMGLWDPMYDYWLSVPLPCGQHMARLQNTKIIMTEPTCLAMAFSINSLIWAGASKVLTISDGAIDLRFSPLIQKKQLGSSKYFTTTTLCCN